MKIVDREEFLKMPSNTVFAKYKPCLFGDISIKGETTVVSEPRHAEYTDFYSMTVTDAIRSSGSVEFSDILQRAPSTGESIPMDFCNEGRDGLYDQDQLFAVWENDDISGLIERLEECRRLPQRPEGGEA